MDDRDMCANCGHWREEHYNRSGVFVADRLFNCIEYSGTGATDEQRKTKAKDIKATSDAAFKLRVG